MRNTHRLSQTHRTSMVVVISVVIFSSQRTLAVVHTPTTLGDRRILLLQDRAYRKSLPATLRQITIDSLGDIWKRIYFMGHRNRSALWLLIFVRYTNTLTCVLTYTQAHLRVDASFLDDDDNDDKNSNSSSDADDQSHTRPCRTYCIQLYCAALLYI